MASAAIQSSLVQPDIGYTPDLDKYLARVKRRLENDPDALEKSLPAGFPKQLVSDLVWEGETVGDKYEWAYELNAQQIAEIEEGLRHFQGIFRLPELPDCTHVNTLSSEQASWVHQPRHVPAANVASYTEGIIARASSGPWVQGLARVACV